MDCNRSLSYACGGGGAVVLPPIQPIPPCAVTSSPPYHTDGGGCRYGSPPSAAATAAPPTAFAPVAPAQNCPHCERDSPPRRRTRSETAAVEMLTLPPVLPPSPCCCHQVRRRPRDMKSISSSNCNSVSNGLSNHSHHQRRFLRCCAEEFAENLDREQTVEFFETASGRVRSNLCELPTSYISNNCQNLSGVPSKAPHDSSYYECVEKPVPVATYLHQNQTGHYHRYHHHHHHHHNHQNQYHNNSPQQQQRQKVEAATKTVGTETSDIVSIIAVDRSDDHLLLETTVIADDDVESLDTADDVKMCSYYDKMRDAVVTNPIRDRYHSEMETLREKLRHLQSVKYRNLLPRHGNAHGASTIAQNHSGLLTVTDLDSSAARKTPSPPPQIEIIENVAEYRRRHGLPAGVRPHSTVLHKSKGPIRLLVRPKSPDVPPSRRSGRITLKTRSKLSAVKLRKRRAKESKVGAAVPRATTMSSSDFTESECDSEAEYSNTEEEPPTECPSESSTSTSEEPVTPVNVVDRREQTNYGDLRRFAQDDVKLWPLRESLFAYVPPYICFNSYDAVQPNVVPLGKKYLKWKLSTITPIVVRKTLTNTGFVLVRSEFSRESNDWCGTWGKHMKSPMFRTLKNTQKLNHFAGTFQLGRKDRLWRNMQRMAQKYGQKEFDFLPQTFILPQDLKLLKHNWHYKNGSGGEKWIIKPPASARGVGIKVINRWSQLPKRMSLIVQRYVSDPYLINGSKFDLRLYVLVTSFNPMRIYLYPDGLARFASSKYSHDDRDLKDRFMHLTNYSINKLSSQYTANEDANSCSGHKWTLKKLWEYLEKRNVNTKHLWANLQHLVIKTMLCGELPIVQLCAENQFSRYNCYELFGVDVLLDSDLKPWLLEVNISPSLHSASPLDAHVKGPLVQALLNLSQFHLPPKLKKVANSPPTLDTRLYSVALTKREREKHNRFSQMDIRSEYLEDILDTLTGDDLRVLLQAEDELTVKGPFERIFPTARTYKYLEFVERRYYNRLCDAWENLFEKNRKPGIRMLQMLCNQKIHLKVASQSSVAKKSLSMINTQIVHEQRQSEAAASAAELRARGPPDYTLEEDIAPERPSYDTSSLNQLSVVTDPKLTSISKSGT